MLLRAQLLLCFGSSPSLEVHLGTILLPELLPPWECKDKPYQGWFFAFIFFFFFFSEGPPSSYSWTTGLKKLPEHRTLEEGVLPSLSSHSAVGKASALDLEIREQGGGSPGRQNSTKYSTHTRPSRAMFKACCPRTLGENLNFRRLGSVN